jgi:beta-glucosidase
MRTISAPIDFFGVNIYHALTVRATEDGFAQRVEPMPGTPRSSFQWAITPEALYWGPRFLHERYKLPVVITENGIANPDWVNLDGAVEDPQRIDFTRRYLRALGAAIADGVDVRGYFHWSLMDNFEWAEGYKQRFGLIHVDFESLKRTPKASYHWYQQVIASNGASL